MMTTVVMMAALAMTGQNSGETPGTLAAPSFRRQQELAATAARRKYVRARARQHNAVADMQTAAVVGGILADAQARGAAESARLAGAQGGRTGPSTVHQWQVREQYVWPSISSNGTYIPGFRRLVPQ